MNLFEEAVIYSTVMHAGKKRKRNNAPYILHPLEVSQIISTMTDDIEVIAAGVLHDVVEDTDGTIEEIRNRFGERVAKLVASETENKYEGEDKGETWERRKKETLKMLANSNDKGIKMLWLADKLSNMRSLARAYSEEGNKIWEIFNQKDPNMHKWYYKAVAEQLEIDLNRTGAFKEYIRHINSIWPGTIDSDKAKYKKYRELSVEGCKVIGKGAKGTVYRYDDELVVKVYNEKNLFKDIETEINLSKKAFVAGIPTAISFGIVTVGNQYGSMFELLNSDCVSNLIAKNPDNVESYAKEMAAIARDMHGIDGSKMGLDDYTATVYEWIKGGVLYEDSEVANKINGLIDGIAGAKTLIHGDYHTGNVMEQDGEFLIIDMDHLSTCHPIVELSGIYMFYAGLGELDPSVIENFMGFSYDTSKAFYKFFMENYLNTKDEDVIANITDKAALLAYARMVRKCYKKTQQSDNDRAACGYYMNKINNILSRVDSLDL